MRERNFKYHSSFFSNYPDLFILPKQLKDSRTGWLAYPIILKENIKFSRKQLQLFLEKNNIQTRVIFTGNILRQPGFKNIKCNGVANDFPNSDYIMRNGILIGCHHGLSIMDIKYIQKIIKKFINIYY